jgi:hypothetical protein
VIDHNSGRAALFHAQFGIDRQRFPSRVEACSEQTVVCAPLDLDCTLASTSAGPQTVAELDGFALAVRGRDQNRQGRCRTGSSPRRRCCCCWREAPSEPRSLSQRGRAASASILPTASEPATTGAAGRIMEAAAGPSTLEGC